MTNSCKSKNLKFKLDLHIVVLNDGEAVIDGMTAEVAKRATKHNLHGDKLKSILATSHSLAMLEDLYLIYETNQIDPNDAIKRVVEESGRKKKLNVKAWTTKVFYNNDYDDLVEDNEEQEQVDEDSDNRNEDEYTMKFSLFAPMILLYDTSSVDAPEI
ncbi:hypothetical protein G6F56_000808 [Rhizopus delemar]|nr:hypothetical protein G6F56_000808 [Rhizopus delemar]